MTIDFQIRFPVVDTELSRLHHDAFGGRYECAPWRSRLERHSKSWVGAFSDGQLCGFVHAVWDGGAHAFLLDTAVAPRFQHQGVGTSLVSRIVSDLQTTDVEWLHVDYEAHLADFYSVACGFGPTTAGLLRLK
ncbi:GNAT family N-acetyltransferase [Rhodococcus sp. P1Y]|uniref:GNAT family N-acetyltransferase n=1 Tax=Rhodococcus sp. P1Y TaxID=1302308 RepID=UPI000EB0D296|nr:GNAT family N-acetyltransferase [Rhodococcus sp. P1Y]AYJ51517.1 GNAT family N-acetyltransferase [Rhodococcus sp. P1Y]